MSLRALVQDAVVAGYSAIGDIPESVTFSTKAQTVFNPTTGQVTRPASSYGVSMVFAQYNKHEIDGEMIKPEDMKGLLAAKDIGFVPQIGDTITRGSAVWSVKDISIDPAGSLYIFQLRKP